MAVVSKEGRRPPDVLVLRLLCEPELGRAFSGLQVAGVKCLGRNKCWERVPGQGSQARDLEGTRDLAGTGRRACRLSGKGRAGLGPRRAPTARREWRVLRRPPSCRPRGRGGCQCPRAKAPGAGPASAAASPSATSAALGREGRARAFPSWRVGRISATSAVRPQRPERCRQTLRVHGSCPRRPVCPRPPRLLLRSGETGRGPEGAGPAPETRGDTPPTAALAAARPSVPSPRRGRVSAGRPHNNGPASGPAQSLLKGREHPFFIQGELDFLFVCLFPTVISLFLFLW